MSLSLLVGKTGDLRTLSLAIARKLLVINLLVMQIYSV